MSEQQFADFTWQSRWNKNQGLSTSISQSGSKVMLLTVMGVVSFDLASPHDDIVAFSHMMTQAIQMLQQTKQEYDAMMGSLGKVAEL